MSKALAFAPAVNTAKTKLPSIESDPFYGSISKHKYAEFSLCDKDGNAIASPVIRALLTEGDKSIESQWQTPFENSNPELKMPMLMANLQTGQMLQAAATLGENSPFISALSDMASGPLATAESALKSVEGRTNLTKVNTIKYSYLPLQYVLIYQSFSWPLVMRNQKLKTELCNWRHGACQSHYLQILRCRMSLMTLIQP